MPFDGVPTVYLTETERALPLLVRDFLISAAQNAADPEIGLRALNYCVINEDITALRGLVDTLLFAAREREWEAEVHTAVEKAYLDLGIVRESRSAFEVLRQI